jgi:uncharacterized Zn-binding protein involved in type VI secretion
MPAAFLGSMQVCPMFDGPVPHVGGPIIDGDATVLVNQMPAAYLGSMGTCVGPPCTVMLGAPTVLVSNMPAAYVGSTTDHGGAITVGAPTVLVG